MSAQKMEVLLAAGDIVKRVGELGEEISRDYGAKNLLLICVLKGAIVFTSDLMRSLTTPLAVDFMAVSSYGASTSSSGVVRILKDLDKSIEDKDVLIVEDIVDTGLTLNYLKENLLSRKPMSLKIVTLLDKPDRREVGIKLDYCGFEIPDRFVVGYGLDFNEHYRQLPDICVLHP